MRSPDFCLVFGAPLQWFQRWKIKFGFPDTKLWLVQIDFTGMSIIETGGGIASRFWHLQYYCAARHPRLVGQTDSAGGRNFNSLEDSPCLSLTDASASLFPLFSVCHLSFLSSSDGPFGSADSLVSHVEFLDQSLCWSVDNIKTGQ